MQYSYAKYKHFFNYIYIYILQHVGQATAMIRNESVHLQVLYRIPYYDKHHFSLYNIHIRIVSIDGEGVHIFFFAKLIFFH